MPESPNVSSIDSIKHRRPPHAPVPARLPGLAQGAIGVRRPGDAVRDFRTVGQAALALHDHLSVHDAAGEVEDGPGVVDPRLVPLVVARVSRVEALAPRWARTGPRLLQRTAVQDAFDAIGAGALTRRQRDLPLTNPEVELTMLGCGAGSGRRLLRTGELRGHRYEKP